MQSVTLSDVIREVKVILDENITEVSVLTDDPDQLQLEGHIRARIIDAVRAIHEAADSSLLDDGLPIPLEVAGQSTIQVNPDGTGYVALPDDFMRLVIFKMTKWKRPVVFAISDTDPRYFLQKSRFVGIRGGIDKPVCAITTGEASKVLEFYSLPAGEVDHSVEKHRYLPLPTIEENDTIKMCRKLVRPIYYQCAALVALSLKDQSSANLFEIAKSYLI